MTVKANKQETHSTVYVKNQFVMSVSNRISQLYNTKTNELYRIDFDKKKLRKQSFKKAKQLKSMITPFISGNETSEEKLKEKRLGYSVSKRHLKNNSSAAKISASFVVTTEAKKLIKSLAAYMRRLRDLIPIEFPIKKDELVLDMSFKWKLNSMAKMFLTGKNKRFIEMNSTMKINSISEGIEDQRLFKKVLSFSVFKK